MQTYVALINYTQQGVQAIKESPARLEAAKAAYKASGGELKAFYLTMGRYDAIAIGEVPDEQTAARLALILAGQGNIRTESLRAFTEEEYKTIIAGLP